MGRSRKAVKRGFRLSSGKGEEAATRSDGTPAGRHGPGCEPERGASMGRADWVGYGPRGRGKGAPLQVLRSDLAAFVDGVIGRAR